MTNIEQVQVAVMKMTESMFSDEVVQTVMRLVRQHRRGENGSLTLSCIQFHLKIVAYTAQSMSMSPQTWSCDGRYSDVQFTLNYFPDPMGLETSLANAIAGLSVESAQHSLLNISQCALALVKELDS